MNYIIELLNYLGLSFSDITNPFLRYILWGLILNILALGCVINIILYYFCIYLVSDSNRLDLIKLKLPVFIRPYFLTYINFYKNFRIVTIWLEVCCLLFLLIVPICFSIMLLSEVF